MPSIRADNPAGTARSALLDLADLDSVAAFAEAFRAGNARLDLLVDNAGSLCRHPPARNRASGPPTSVTSSSPHSFLDWKTPAEVFEEQLHSLQ